MDPAWISFPDFHNAWNLHWPDAAIQKNVQVKNATAISTAQSSTIAVMIMMMCVEVRSPIPFHFFPFCWVGLGQQGPLGDLPI